jgi:hypothetical protein
MGYYDAVINPQECWVGEYRNREKVILMESISHILDQWSQLSAEQSEEVIKQIVASNNQILNEVQVLQEENRELPLELPLPLPPNLSLKAWKQKGSTRKWALTGAEASEHQQKAMTRA